MDSGLGRILIGTAPPAGANLLGCGAKAPRHSSNSSGPFCESRQPRHKGATYPWRSPDWLKFKNPEAPAVRREAEEDWAK